jgi:hypothetical protein
MDKGHCYERASLFMMKLPEAERERYVLCHGILINPAAGNKFGHAWVEDTREMETLEFAPRRRVPIRRRVSTFERLYRPLLVLRYSVADTFRLGSEARHHGPWDERFFADDVAHAV